MDSVSIPMSETKTAQPTQEDRLLEIINAGYNIPIFKSEIAQMFGFSKFNKLYKAGKITEDMITDWGYELPKFKSKKQFHFTNDCDLNFLMWVKSKIGNWR